MKMKNTIIAQVFDWHVLHDVILIRGTHKFLNLMTYIIQQKITMKCGKSEMRMHGISLY